MKAKNPVGSIRHGIERHQGSCVTRKSQDAVKCTGLLIEELVSASISALDEFCAKKKKTRVSLSHVCTVVTDVLHLPCSKIHAIGVDSYNIPSSISDIRRGIKRIKESFVKTKEHSAPEENGTAALNGLDESHEYESEEEEEEEEDYASEEDEAEEEEMDEEEEEEEDLLDETLLDEI